MMKDMMKSFKDFDDFLKTQIIIVGLISFVWALIIPLITKLQGMLWTTSIISAYLIAQKASAFIYPYFKDMKINKCYKSLIILDILYAISLTIYFVNINVFVYVEALLTLVYGIIISVFTINYNTYVGKVCKFWDHNENGIRIGIYKKYINTTNYPHYSHENYYANCKLLTQEELKELGINQ